VPRHPQKFEKPLSGTNFHHGCALNFHTYKRKAPLLVCSSFATAPAAVANCDWVGRPDETPIGLLQVGCWDNLLLHFLFVLKRNKHLLYTGADLQGGSSPPTAAESMEPLLSPLRISAMGALSRRGWS
jgi:hypothetical protein